MTLFQALITQAAEFGALCPMKTITLINGRAYFPPPPLRPCNHLSRTILCSASCFIPSFMTGLYSFFPPLNKTWQPIPIDLMNSSNSNTFSRMTGYHKREKAAAEEWVDFPNLNLPAEHFTRGTTLIFPQMRSVSNRPACSADNASCACACWRSVKNRSIYCCAAIYHGKYVHPEPVRA